MFKPISILLLAGVLGGCAVGPEYRAQQVDLPETWPTASALDEQDTAVDQTDWARWWQLFDDPVLDRLVARAVEDNFDVRMQAARVLEARAQLGLARSEQWPTLSAQAEATRQRQPAALAGVQTEDDSVTGNLFSVSGLLNYELDLWGRVSREREGAEALLEESVFAGDALRLNVVSDLVATYFNLRSAQMQLQIARDDLTSREETLRLQRIRHDAGEADELVLRQAESEVATARAQLPLLVEQVRVIEGALGRLVGMSPAELLALDETDFGTRELADVRLPDEVPDYLPSELLERRPDIRAAEQQVRAATAQVGVAEAARLPSLNLTALFGSAAMQSGDLFTSASETWSVGAGLAGPLIDFGASRSVIEGAEARMQQAQLHYRATVNQAFSEVRDALVLHETSADRLKASAEQRDAVARTLELAEIRYEAGYIGFLDLLDARRNMLAAETAYSEAKRDRLNASANLFKALGGGWAEPV